MTNRQNCPILDRATPVDETSFSRDGWKIVQCRETGLVFLANPPGYAQLESEFAWEQTSAAESANRASREPVMAFVSSFTKWIRSVVFPRRNKIAAVAHGLLQGDDHAPPTTVLDIGCGAGDLMVEVHHRQAAIGRDVIPVGIEVSPQLAAHSQEQVSVCGGKVIRANALDGLSKLPEGSTTIALMSSFLEHERQPLRLLQQLHSVLVPGGAIVLKVPNFACWNRRVRGRRWCGFRFPDHVNYFTPQTLRTLAHEAGFTVTRQSVWDKFPLSDNMYAILKKRP